MPQMIAANGIQQRYEVVGEGPWLTLVHGSGDNLGGWALQAPEFAKHYRVLTYDVRGHGETETPDAPAAQSTFVEDLRGLLDALGIDRTALLGYSMGAGIVRNFAAAYPERTWAAVLSNGGRLDPPPSPEREQEMAAMREQRMASIERDGMSVLFEGYLPNVYTPGFAAAHPEVVEWHRSVALANDPRKYIRMMRGGMGAQPAPDLSRVTCPVLVIVGEGDEYTGPEQGAELATALPWAELKVFPTRHGSAFEMPQEYNRTVPEFLAKARP